MEKVEFKDILGNALVIVNDTKDCKSLFNHLFFDFNKILIDTVFGFWGYDDMIKFNPHRVVVDMRNVSKETLEKVVKDVREYNEKVWKYHLDKMFSDDFVEEQKYCFYAANNYVNEDTPFCPGFVCHKGDTKDKIYDNHKCKVLVYNGKSVEEYE